MTRRIPSLLLIAALTTLSACDAASIMPAVGGASGLQAPPRPEADGSLFMKWLTTPPGGVNGLKCDGCE